MTAIYSLARRNILKDRRPSTAACWMVGTKEMKKLTCKEKNMLYWADNSSHGIRKNLLYRYDKPNNPTKEGSLSFVLFKSPFTSVSTVRRGHKSLWYCGSVSYLSKEGNEALYRLFIKLANIAKGGGGGWGYRRTQIRENTDYLR
jgi:hypothetical protein